MSESDVPNLEVTIVNRKLKKHKKNIKLDDSIHKVYIYTCVCMY